MSDRIAVMSEGEIQQIGTAHQIYEEPDNRFVADFIGETNLIAATVVTIDGLDCTCRLSDGTLLAASSSRLVEAGTKGRLSVRPERLSIVGPGQNAMAGEIVHQIYLGTDTQHRVHLTDGTEISVRTQNAHGATPQAGRGDRVGLVPDQGAVRLLVD